ncbi:MAG: GNAT family N-acetyltransferase [Anaerolineae bacterium]
MKLDREKLRRDILWQYAEEHRALGREGTLRLLEEGREWDLAPKLNAGGVLVFPHVGVADCGHQVAAVVHACLDCGAERVLVISVLHALADEMEAARVRVAHESDLAMEPLRGIQGPGLPGRQDWRSDHALTSFRHFWKAETERRGIQGPESIERFPYLVGGEPHTLPGIEELEAIARDAAIVSTADPFHHGIGYGDAPDKSLWPEQGGLELARRRIEDGIALLGQGDYWGYNQHCVQAKSDARDAGQVFRHLCGPMKGQILDLTDSDATDLYKAPPPTWVAAALIEWQPIQGLARAGADGSGWAADDGCQGETTEARLGGIGDSDEVIAIRTATGTDVHRLAMLCGQLGYPSTSAQVRQRLDELQQNEDQVVFVAEEVGGQVVGWVQVFGRQLLVVDRHAELGGLVVDEGHRGLGVGARLMERAEDWARARGCETLYVRSNVVREDAHRFYEVIGYNQIKTSRVFLKELGGTG